MLAKKPSEWLIWKGKMVSEWVSALKQLQNIPIAQAHSHALAHVHVVKNSSSFVHVIAIVSEHTLEWAESGLNQRKFFSAIYIFT